MEGEGKALPFFFKLNIMIVFNECRVDSNLNALIVEVSIDNAEPFKDVYLDSIFIDTDETYTENDGKPSKSDHPVFSVSNLMSYHPGVTPALTEDSFVTNDEHQKIFVKGSTGCKSCRLILKEKDLRKAKFFSNIFYVYAYVVDESLATIPDERLRLSNPEMCVAIDLKPLYNEAMAFVRELGDKQQVPRNFIDLHLRLQSVEYAFKTGHYFLANKLWKRFFKPKMVYIKDHYEFKHIMEDEEW